MSSFYYCNCYSRPPSLKSPTQPAHTSFSDCLRSIFTYILILIQALIYIYSHSFPLSPHLCNLCHFSSSRIILLLMFYLITTSFYIFLDFDTTILPSFFPSQVINIPSVVFPSCKAKEVPALTMGPST